VRERTVPTGTLSTFSGIISALVPENPSFQGHFVKAAVSPENPLNLTPLFSEISQNFKFSVKFCATVTHELKIVSDIQDIAMREVTQNQDSMLTCCHATAIS